MSTKNSNKLECEKSPFERNKHEIFYNLINSVIAGALVFLGSIADGSIGASGVMASISAALIACFIKFKNYWNSQKKEYQANLLNFL